MPHFNAPDRANLTTVSAMWEGMKSASDRGLHFFLETEKRWETRLFSDLYSDAVITAAKLQTLGIKPGDQVILSAKTSLDVVKIWLGLVWLGATPVPLPPMEVLVGGKTYHNRIRNVVPYFSYYICLDIEKPTLEELKDTENKELRLLSLTEVLTSEPAAGFNPSKPCELTRTDTAFIQFTSGSTKKPRGMIISYQNLFTNVNEIWNRLEVNTSGLKAGSWLPFYHDMGLVGYLLGCLFTQTDLRLVSPSQFAKRPIQFLEFIHEFRIEICTMPNFALEWILRRFDPADGIKLDLSCLKWFGTGAEPVKASVLERFNQTFKDSGLKPGAISPCYGLAEATLAVTINEPLRGCRVVEYLNKPYVTNGHPLPSMEIKVIKEHPSDKAGIIKIKGANVAEYALMNGEKKGLLEADGYYNTQDIGFFEGDELVVLGRCDEMFIVNGENHFPYHIEDVVIQLGCSSNNRVACFMVPYQESASGKDELVLVFEWNARAKQTQEEACETIKAEVLKNFGLLLSDIVPVAQRMIPITSSGKIQRNSVKKMYLEGAYLKTASGNA